MNDTSAIATAGGAGLYRMIWRWHFYAGIFCIPFILTLAVSGTIYLFKPQIDALVNRPYQQLDASGVRHSPDAQIAAAVAAVPGSVFLNYQLPQTDREAVLISVNRRGERILNYVNPYTLEVMKTIGYDDQFIRQVRTFHGELMAGNVGSVIIELAGCWAIVMILTGLYLWWPRNARGLGGVLYPRVHLKGRLFWRDLHVVLGIWVSAFTLFLLISGLPWSLVWGKAFKEVRSLGQPVAVVQDWSAGRAEEAAVLGEHASHAMQGPASTRQLHLDRSVVEAARQLGFAPPVLLSRDKINSHHWSVISNHQNRPRRENARLDGSGGLLERGSFADRPLVDRVIGIGVAAHEGQLFGWFNQLLGVFTTTALSAISISGFILWRRRKPAGKLGAPAVMPNRKAGRAVSVTVFGLALLLPLLAISLIVLFVAEFLLLRQLPGTRRWLGLA
ncbi:PepSY-associated TM helix domain-containing protein [Microbulbifer taiwanensis]|uniref:PepSY-associated TM helix domain-containing protein n=1 Tax=Microbulbifer taiwanensis TaxID=986746 RepID=A0ABW1YHR8_9GAMM|nr:PepSY domain-containing protein [Microbulbifer taiwanensis]